MHLSYKRNHTSIFHSCSRLNKILLHDLSSHPLIVGQSGCFLLVVAVNSASTNVSVHVSLGMYSSYLLGYTSSSGIAESMVIFCLNLQASSSFLYVISPIFLRLLGYYTCCIALNPLDEFS